MGLKTALLHIGTPKTGTTSIQQCLSQAQVNGSLAPVCYPLQKGEHNQRRIVVLYSKHDELSRSIRADYRADDGRFQRMRTRYRDFLFAQLRSPKDAILSAEGLSTFMPMEATRLRDDLESLGFRDFHVVLYIRDPADYYLSIIQQRLRGPAEPPFVSDPALFQYEFRRIAETWEHAFPGSLIVRRYPSANQHDVVDDFASVLKENMGISLPRFPMRMNTTLSAEAMQILQDYRGMFWPDNDGFLTPDSAALAEFLQQSGTDLHQTKPVLQEHVATQIRANHMADAERIFSRYGVDLVLAQLSPTPGGSRSQSYSVDEILESVDPEIVRQLLLRFARTELGRTPAKRPLPLRIAARAYRAIPPSQRPARLAGWLKSFGSGER